MFMRGLNYHVTESTLVEPQQRASRDHFQEIATHLAEAQEARQAAQAKDSTGLPAVAPGAAAATALLSAADDKTIAAPLPAAAAAKSPPRHAAPSKLKSPPRDARVGGEPVRAGNFAYDMGLSAIAFEAVGPMSFQQAKELTAKLEPSLQAKLDAIDAFLGEKLSPEIALRHLHEKHISEKPSAVLSAADHLARQLEWESQHSKEVSAVCAIALDAILHLRDFIPRILMGANSHHQNISARAVEGAPACTVARTPARTHARKHACLRALTHVLDRAQSFFVSSPCDQRQRMMPSSRLRRSQRRRGRQNQNRQVRNPAWPHARGQLKSSFLRRFGLRVAAAI